MCPIPTNYAKCQLIFGDKEILFAFHLFRVIPCKGSRYPPTLPRPAVHILQFELPLCDMNTEKGKMEVHLGGSAKTASSKHRTTTFVSV